MVWAYVANVTNNQDQEDEAEGKEEAPSKFMLKQILEMLKFFLVQ